MWTKSAKARFIMKITAFVLLLSKQSKEFSSAGGRRNVQHSFIHVPDVSAEDPQGSGVEEQAGDEEQQVEVRVHPIHHLVEAG